MSIKGGLYNAPKQAMLKEYTSFQLFTRSPRQWKTSPLKSEDITEFKSFCKSGNFTDFAVHLPYLPNFATSNSEIRKKSLAVLQDEIQRCDMLDIPYLVIHIGSHRGEGIEIGVQNVVTAMNQTINENSKVKVLLETSSGSKNSVGSNFEEIARIIEQVNYQDNIGVCFDTCHVFASGYDLQDENAVNLVINQFDDIIGLTKLNLIHLNDSKGELNSKRDRHQHIGQGYIGLNGFEAILNHPNLNKIPMIMETPVNDEGNDEVNFETVLKLINN